MNFLMQYKVDTGEALRLLGYKMAKPDARTETNLQEACRMVEAAAKPYWTYTGFTLNNKTELAQTGFILPGKDIQAHLEGCRSCLLIGVTLGVALEQAIRVEELTNMEMAVLMDAAASALIEQYADEAEVTLRAQYEAKGEFLTSRFSPGYGDLPLEIQGEVVRLIDGPRAIGLTVSGSGILLPRKSITAVIGVADHPVKGKLASCEGCKFYTTCKKKKEGGCRGKVTIE